MLDIIKEAIRRLDSLSKQKQIKIISHNDTDGITSAAIFSRALQRWNKQFSLEIVKNLDKTFIENLPEDQILIFLDLASNSLDYIKDKKTESFILDHHEVTQEIPSNITLINPILSNKENICASAVCYLFAKELSQQNTDLANLAIIGMVGDMHEANINKTYKEILEDSEVTIKKGLLLYPATRPLDRVLENSIGFYIPDITGSYKGTIELLKEAKIDKTQKGYKSLAELTEEEMSNLTTAILLKQVNNKESQKRMIGNIYLIKFFNQLEDTRELSALINACSRMDNSHISLGLCLGNKEMKKKAESIYTKYRKTISSALNQIQEIEKIEGNNYIIINAKNKIKDTIIGTVTSIISFSPVYPKGTIIISLAYTDNDKIKISARIAGREGRNVREILAKIITPLPGEVGGHPIAAGGLISKEKESEFLEKLKKFLEIEVIKV